MYAGLEDGNTALEYLRILPFKNVSSTTMYAEGNPVIESPFSAATSIHDMLLQSWGGRIRVMPAVPDEWKDISFQDLLCQGGATVSADRRDGRLVFARIDSPGKDRDVEFSIPMDRPIFSIVDSKSQAREVSVGQNPEGFHEFRLPAGCSLVVRESGSEPVVALPVNDSKEGGNIFGYNERFEKVIAGFERVRKDREEAQRLLSAVIELDRGLVEHWSFDEPSSMGVPVKGRLKEGVGFDGGAVLDLGHDPKFDLKSQLTLSAWIKPEDFSGYPGVIGKGYEVDGAYSLQLRPGGGLWFELQNEAGERVVYQPRDGVLKAGEWVHVVASYDGESMQVYLDGEVAGSGREVSGLKLNQSGSPLRLGWLGKYGHFKGVIDEVRVYERALTRDEVLALSREGVKDR